MNAGGGYYITMGAEEELQKYIDAVTVREGFVRSPAAAARRAGELRAALARAVLPPAGEEFAEAPDVERGKAYVDAVVGYVGRASLAHPIDPVLVVDAFCFVPRWPAPAGGRGRAAGGAPLVFGGLTYCDPLAGAAAGVFPDTPAAYVVGGARLAPAAAAAALRTVFVWRDNPLDAVVTRAGRVAVPGPRGGWKIVGGLPADLLLPGGGDIEGGLQNTEGGENGLRNTGGTENGLQNAGGVTPHARGRRGELHVADVLAGAFPLYDVRLAAHRARAADIQVDAAGRRVCVEAKNYTTAVPEKEVAKFLRDLGARGAAAGVFVSLAAGIAGIRGRFSARLEVLPLAGRTVPVVYVCGAHPDVIVAALEVALLLSARRGPPPPQNPRLYASDAGNAADVCEDARARLQKLARAVADGTGRVAEQLGGVLRDLRLACDARRPGSEDAGSHALLGAKYKMSPEVGGILRELLRALDAVHVLGDVDVGKRWALTSLKARNLRTGMVISFTKKTKVGFPLASVPPGAVAGLLARHPAAEVVAGAVTLPVGPDTAPDLFALAL